jgi:PhoPQ-activated pathogenicity-related protein
VPEFMKLYRDCLEIYCPNNVQADISALILINCNNQPQEKKGIGKSEEVKEKTQPNSKSYRHRLDQIDKVECKKTQ